jgi:hypothetical protein
VDGVDGTLQAHADTVQVPESLRGTFPQIASLLKDLSENAYDKRIANPSFVPAIDNSSAVGQQYIYERRAMDEDQYMAKKGRLRELCSDINKKIRA